MPASSYSMESTPSPASAILRRNQKSEAMHTGQRVSSSLMVSSNRIIMIHRPLRLMTGVVLVRDWLTDPCPRLLFHPGHPHGRPSRASQQEKEAQDGDELENHGNGPEPEILPPPELVFPLHLLLIQPPELEPSVVRQFAEARPGDHDECDGADVGDEVEGEEDDQLDYLYHAPRLVFGASGWLAEHSDSVRGIDEEDALRRDEVGEAVVDQGGLQRACQRRYLEVG
jgi:hypothetical protein